MSAWIFALLLSVVPPGQHPRETYDVAVHRYASIADDVASVTNDRRTAALLVAIAVHESGLRADVDDGRTRGPAPYYACGLWQISGLACSWVSRQEQARIARELALASLGTCVDNPARFRLAAYASGSCDKGWKESGEIYDIWHRILGGTP